MNMTTVRSLIRPLVTAGLVGAFIVAAFRDPAAAETLKILTIAVVAYWFGGRGATND